MVHTYYLKAHIHSVSSQIKQVEVPFLIWGEDVREIDGMRSNTMERKIGEKDFANLIKTGYSRESASIWKKGLP